MSFRTAGRPADRRLHVAGLVQRAVYTALASDHVQLSISRIDRLNQMHDILLYATQEKQIHSITKANRYNAIIKAS